MKKTSTVYGNCFDEYISLTKTDIILKIKFSANMSDAVTDRITQAVARVLETEFGFGYECGDMIKTEEISDEI